MFNIFKIQNGNFKVSIRHMKMKIQLHIFIAKVLLFFRIYTLTWNTNAQYAPDDMNCQKLLGLEEISSNEFPDIFCLGYKY